MKLKFSYLFSSRNSCRWLQNHNSMRTENWITFKKITFYAKKISQIQDMKIAYPIRKHIYSEQLFFYPFLGRIKRGGREEIKTAPKVRATSSLQLSAWLPGASWAAYPQFLRGRFLPKRKEELHLIRHCRIQSDYSRPKTWPDPPSPDSSPDPYCWCSSWSMLFSQINS